ncbi:MAG: RNA polymerase sigma factor [Anaerolineales bacterium]|nr:RNA polymerase sigma factor [Anaerolineales bacterium]
MSTADTATILRLQAGNLEALGELYDRYRLIVYHTALAITRDPDVADDILQEAFLRLHTYAASVKSELPLAPWLYRVTINLSYTWFSRRRWLAPLDEFLEKLTGPARHHPEPAAEQRDAHEAMQRAIDALPFNQRVVVVLHYLNDLSLQEIAEILKCPVGTVKSRLYYARETLRQKLEGSAFSPEVAYEFTR